MTVTHRDFAADDRRTPTRMRQATAFLVTEARCRRFMQIRSLKCALLSPPPLCICAWCSWWFRQYVQSCPTQVGSVSGRYCGARLSQRFYGACFPGKMLYLTLVEKVDWISKWCVFFKTIFCSQFGVEREMRHFDEWHFPFRRLLLSMPGSICCGMKFKWQIDLIYTRRCFTSQLLCFLMEWQRWWLCFEFGRGRGGGGRFDI